MASVNQAFAYRDGWLSCEAVPLAEIAASVGTPVYVYSRAELTRRAEDYVRAIPSCGLACFAVKANGNPSIIQLLGELGMGADVTSGGELYLALHAGIPAKRIIYSGVGKTAVEIESALEAGIRSLHVESEMELSAVSHIADRLQKVARIGVRVNPNISAETHPYISTGLEKHKFGVPPARAIQLYRLAAADPWLSPVGVAAHLGSQITALGPFSETVRFLVDFAQELQSTGIAVEFLDVGGGLGIDYLLPSRHGEPASQAPPSNRDWTLAVMEPIVGAGYEIVVEPGRSVVGPAGALLTRATYLKEQGERSFVIADAGMNDLLRPALYDASHPIMTSREPVEEAVMRTYDVVGPICESGDWLAKSRLLPQLAKGDLVAILQAGAYGFSMSSNYNGRLRAAEVLVDGDSFQIIRRRQVYEHLLDGCLDGAVVRPSPAID